jgi:hypothetical protein
VAQMLLNITTGESGTDLSSGNERPSQSDRVKMNTNDLSNAEDCDRRRRTGFDPARPLLAGLLFVMALTPCPLLAQTNTAKAPLPSNRYLLVVETSRSMQRRSDAVVQTVQHLLKSGFGGQLRRGDTLGIWTYNESLHVGRFPLQKWSPERQQDVTLHTIAFLKGQKYEKQASIDKVLPSLSGVIKASPLITVILISSADETIRGTPFDARINAFYQEWHDEQQKARRPFVTVLRGQDGQLADFTVNAPPWPVQMPLLPQEAKNADTVQNKLPEAGRAAPPPTTPPLIISGKKAQPEPAPVPKPEPLGANVQAPAPAPEATSGSKSPTINQTGPATQPAQIVKPEAAPPVPDKVSPDLPPTPSSATTPVQGPKAGVVQGPETKPATPAAATPEAASALPPPASQPKPAAPELPKPSPALDSKPAPVPTPVTEPKVGVVNGPETKPVAPAPSKAEAAAALPAPAPNPGPAVPATKEVLPGPSTNSAVAASVSPRSSSLSPPPSPLPVAPAQTATAVPAETLVGHASIWIAGLVLAGVAISFVFLLRRRARATQGASLITQSFERKNKP